MGDNNFPPEIPDPDSQTEILRQLQNGLYQDSPKLQISRQYLSRCQDFTHPILGLLYYKKRVGQIAFKGITPGPALGLLISLIINVLRVAISEDEDSNSSKTEAAILTLLRCDVNCSESPLLKLDNLTLPMQIGLFLVAYFATFFLLVVLAYLLGYIAGRFSFGPESLGVSLNGLYHDYPYGRRYSSWRQFCAVRWYGVHIEKRSKIVKLLIKFHPYKYFVPIRLLFADGGSIRIWGRTKDRKWLTEVMELLIAHNHIDLKGRLPKTDEKL